MNVDEIMTRDVQTCRPDQTLAEAANVLWEHDCGVVPVVDDAGRVVGMLTDRDICMAAFFQGEPLGSISVRTAMSKEVYASVLGDDVREAEKTMRERQVRRLPVLDSRGHLHGLLSVNDLARSAAGKNGRRVDRGEIVETLGAIGRHRHDIVAATH